MSQLPRCDPAFLKWLSSVLGWTGVLQVPTWIPKLPQRHFYPWMDAKNIVEQRIQARDILPSHLLTSLPIQYILHFTFFTQNNHLIREIYPISI